MTEIDWLTGADPSPMLASLEGRAGERKARLFGVWCCRQCECVLPDRRLQAAVALAERLCEQPEEVAEADRRAAEEAATAAWGDLHFDELDDHLLVPARLLGRRYSTADADRDADRLARATEYSESNPDAFDGLAEELRGEQADCLRELFGNPFRPPVALARWLTRRPSTGRSGTRGRTACRPASRAPVSPERG